MGILKSLGVRDTTTWTVRRYKLPNYDKEALNSAMQAWVKQQGLSMKYARGWYVNDIMDTYFVPPEAYDRGEESLAIHYFAPYLYVYTSHYLPPALSRINEEVIAAYVNTRGGETIPQGPYTFTRLKALSPQKQFEKLINRSGSQLPQGTLKEISESRKRSETIPPEEVDVPAGVTRKYGSEKMIERTLKIESSEMLSAEIRTGELPKAILDASIRGTIQQTTGNTYAQSEKVTDEMTLNGGEKGRKYKLFWEDVWLEGTAEVLQNNTRRIVPFKFLKKSELQARQIDSKTGRELRI